MLMPVNSSLPARVRRERRSWSMIGIRPWKRRAVARTHCGNIGRAFDVLIIAGIHHGSSFSIRKAIACGSRDETLRGSNRILDGRLQRGDK